MALRGEALRAQVLKFLLDNRAGVRFTDVAEKFGDKASDRTLSRALEDLAAQGHVVREGEAKRYIYFASAHRQPAVLAKAEEEWTIPLAEDSLETLRYISLPRERRTPVGYDRDFLGAYRPNETFYLPADLRETLQGLGTLAEADGEVGGTALGRIYERLLIDLSWASSRLEGNTYTLLDTKRLLELGEMASGKDVDEATMLLNHRDAILYMIENRDSIGVSRFAILNLHGILSRDLMPDPDDEGRLRRKIVKIGRSVYQPPAIPQVVEEVFDEVVDKGAAIDDPMEQSFFLMVHLPYLQPFTDVNKRTSRLAANIPLLKAGLSPLSFLDVPEDQYVHGILGVYETKRVDLLRDVFAWAYGRSCGYYAAQRQELKVSEKARLTYRQDLTRATRQVVGKRLDPSDETILQLAGQAVPEADAASFARLVRENLDRLHEGNIARYGISLDEYKAWRAARP
ncbi:Fic family protein [Desulfocurvibacter africanus]|uniref:Fic family protein n=1 Tax=Desulfocurvibacter africanus TaxID=873 RepID=UPI002FDB8734